MDVQRYYPWIVYPLPSLGVEGGGRCGEPLDHGGLLGVEGDGECGFIAYTGADGYVFRCDDCRYGETTWLGRGK
jgi:hypothetical protein